MCVLGGGLSSWFSFGVARGGRIAHILIAVAEFVHVGGEGAVTVASMWRQERKTSQFGLHVGACCSCFSPVTKD